MHRLERQLARRREERELLQLLVRGEEISFHARGEKFEHFAARALLLARQALRDPCRQPGPIDRPDVDHRADARERVEPRRALARAVEPRQRNEEELVRGRALAIGADRGGALRAGLAARQPQLDDLLRREKREAAHRVGELAPVVAAPGLEHFALGVAGAARGGAHRVRRFHGEQRLIAVDHVRRQEPLRELGLELVRAQLHYWALGFARSTEASRRITCCTMSLCMSRKRSCSSDSFARMSASLYVTSRDSCTSVAGT